MRTPYAAVLREDNEEIPDLSKAVQTAEVKSCLMLQLPHSFF